MLRKTASVARRALAVFALAVLIWFHADSASYAASPAYDYTNGNSGGVQQILTYQESTPKLIAGMDATGLTAGVPAEVQVNLWVSTNQGNVAKRLRAVLRDGGTNGAALATHNFPQAAVDSTGGHEYQWTFDGTVTPSGTRLSVTIEPYDGYVAVNSYSDNRGFTVHQDAVGEEPPTGGTTLACTEEEACVMRLEPQWEAAILFALGVSITTGAALLVSQWGQGD